MKGVKRKLKLMWSLYPTVVVYTFSEKKFFKITHFMVFFDHLNENKNLTQLGLEILSLELLMTM